MFNYFWEEIGGYLWNEDNLETLIKVLARRELADLLSQVFSSRTTHAIFTAMSYSYRITFIEHLLSTKEELLAEMSSTFDETFDPSDVEDFLYERRSNLAHFFSRLHLCLSESPFAMHFYLTFSKELIRNDHQSGKTSYDEELEVLRRTLKNIRDEDIEVFLHQSTEVAV
jgi:hypothetical protein